jgi:hypothetical protein
MLGADRLRGNQAVVAGAMMVGGMIRLNVFHADEMTLAHNGPLFTGYLSM